VQRQVIVRMFESGPIPAIHGGVRWLLIDLSQWVYEESRITVAQTEVETGVSPDGLPQALGTTPPSCASRGSHRGFLKKIPAKSRPKRRSTSAR
jgi:hypothetical protein